MGIIQPFHVQLVIRYSIFVFAVIPLVFVGCSATGKGESEAGLDVSQSSGAPMKIPLGAVQMVDSEGHFVLIQSSRFIPVEPETTIVTVGSDGVVTAELIISPARKGQFLTADITSGHPKVGDRAIMDYTPKVREPTRDESPIGEDDEIQVLE
tara:strand:- start:2631 stop:3089 length:459 start_codon:yes stop_codon:yes gene_type:complete